MIATIFHTPFASEYINCLCRILLVFVSEMYVGLSNTGNSTDIQDSKHASVTQRCYVEINLFSDLVKSGDRPNENCHISDR